MIVYGDPQYEEALVTLLARLRWRLATLTQSAGAERSLDALRALLIQAGEIEQAAHDGLPDYLSAGETRQVVSRLQRATDHAAAAFYARWAISQSDIPAGKGDGAGDLARMLCTLEQVQPPRDVRLTVKVPEGFAFYALYPEQYCAAAVRWSADHPCLAVRPGVVVGIRSIGTTLSAVVSAALAASGRHAHRLTVRPSGHPSARQLTVDPRELDCAAWALVVDDGPGLSGSSMAATAEALTGAGLDRAHVGFLPSHDGQPQGASDSARAWWATTPRTVIPRSDLRWDNHSLPEALAARTPDLCPTLGPVEQIEDLGGGLWRKYVYPRPDQWPAASVPFEQSKYRCVTRSGAAVLWKFAGQASAPGGGSAEEAAVAQLRARAEAGWAHPVVPLGTAFGFVATPWIEGRPLTRGDADPTVLAHVGRYLVDAAGPPLSPAEGEASLARLREMLYWNTWEALGDAMAERTQGWAELAAELGGANPSPSYGDGHLAPHEWLRTPSGRLIKADCTGHDTDHTIVGRQPLTWDVAGASVEWGLDADAPLIAAVRQAGGAMVPASLLSFYRMAYAAFRMGQCALCAGMSPHDADEETRSWHAYTDYREELERLLASDP